jgi:type II secretory pathway component PulF
MALIVTPGILAKRAEFYFQLSAMIRAGLPLIKSLENIERKPPGSGYRRPIRIILTHLKQGESFAGALHQVGGWLPVFDKALLEAGERSGRIDECFRMLSGYYEATAKRLRQIIGRMIYPIGLLHFALLIFPLDKLKGMILQGDANAYIAQKIATFIPAYLIFFALVFVLQSQRFAVWRSLIEMMTGFVPYLGAARKAIALNRLAAALEALINAGVPIAEAWTLSAAASGSPSLERTVAKWRPQIESGGYTPGELALHSSAFPDMFSSLYKSGEISGQLDDSLMRLREYYQEESTRKLDVFTKVLVGTVVMGVMIAVAYFIISFYAEHFKGIGDALDGLDGI